MRLLILNHEWGNNPAIGGGAGRQAYYLSKQFVKKGHQVTAVTSAFKNRKRLSVEGGIRVYRVPVVRKRADHSTPFEMLTYLFSGFFFLTGHLCQKKYDLIVCFFGFPAGILGFLMRMLFSYKYVVCLRGSDVPADNPYYSSSISRRILKWIVVKVWKRADGITALSNDLKRNALKDCRNLNITVIPNRIDSNFFSEYRARQYKEPFLFVSNSMLEKKKGIEYLIRALVYVKKDYQLQVIGDGREKQKLINLTNRLKLSSSVKFLGFLSTEEIKKRLQQAHILVWPAVVGYYFISNTTIEALAKGLVVIAARVNEVPRILEDEGLGILVRPKNPKEIGNALNYLIDHPTILEQMSRRSYDYARNNLHISVSAEEYLQVFQNVLKNRVK